MSNQVHLYEIYTYADPEGYRKRSIGFTQASSAEEALKQCAHRLNFDAGAEYYVNRIELVGREQFIEFPKEFTLVQRPIIGNSSVFIISPVRTEFEILREKAKNSGISLQEIRRFVQLERELENGNGE